MSFAFIHPQFKYNEQRFDNPETLISAVTDEQTKQFLTAWFDEKDYLLVKTSGSTGVPKEVELLKQYMINSAYATAEYFNLPATSSAFCCLSSTYIAGKMMWIRALTIGWHLDVVAPVKAPLQGNKKSYDFTAMVPLQLQNSLAHLSNIKQLIVGGGAVPDSLRKVLQGYDTKVFVTYGMTETSTHIALRSLKAKSTAYTVLPNITIAVDQRGCLVIYAPHLYHERIITNDLVKLISAQRFEWLGRYDSVVNSGGVKLIPEQIEAKLSAHVTCRFFLCGIPDPQWGQKLIMLVEGEVGLTQLSHWWELAKLHKYEIPKAVYPLATFTETHTGKIDRSACLDRIANSHPL